MGDNVNKNLVLAIATIAALLTPIMGSSINIALPDIGAEFEMDAVLLGWVATSYLLAAAVFLIPFGRLADIYGRKKVFTYGIFIYTLSSLLCALSSNDIMLISFRVLQGFGGAMIFGTSVAIVMSVFPAGERGKALGINVAAVYLGLSLGPFLGGVLTQQFGWRSIFFANVPLGLLIIAGVLWKLKGEWKGEGEGQFDLIGSLLYMASVALVIYGFTSLPASWGIAMAIFGITGIAAFVWWEMRVSSPILRMELFRHNRTFAFSNLAALINYSATFAVAFLLSLYLQYIKGFGPRDAGFILVSMPAVQAIFSPLAGRLSDKVAPRLLASSGMALTTLGLLLLRFLSQDTQIVFILTSLIVLGFGFALFSSPNTNAVMSSAEKKFYGVASATLATMRQIGMTLSMGIAMMIFAIVVGKVQITPEYYPDFIAAVKIAFGIFAGLCFAGIFASLARGGGH
jgi:EmrB/QacA subfamily drug resistance transporter